VVSQNRVDCLTPHQGAKNEEKPNQRFGLSAHPKQKVTKQASTEYGIKYSSQIYELIGFLSRPSSLSQEGLFRRNGKIKQQHELMKLVKEKSKEEIGQLLDSEAYSVHEVATVLKNLLADMSEPLLVEAFYPFHCNLASKLTFLVTLVSCSSFYILQSGISHKDKFVAFRCWSFFCPKKTQKCCTSFFNSFTK
jgi:hypothetical protein